MLRHGADTHKHGAFAVNTQGLFNALCHAIQLLCAGSLVHLMNERHILLTHAQHKVVLAIGEQILDLLHGSNLHPLIHAADDEHAAVDLRCHMKLLGAHVDIGDEDVVGDDVLNEGALVVLLLIVALGGVQRHSSHGADGTTNDIITVGKHGIVKMTTPGRQRLKSLALQRHTFALGSGNGLHVLVPLLADTGQLAAGDHSTLSINNTDGTLSGLLKLQHYILKNSTGHDALLPLL